jgi:type IV pilus assembly protein PilC
MMLGLVGFIVFRVVPAFSDFYASFNRPLPVMTQALVAVSHVLTGNVWLILVAAIVVVFLLRALIKSPRQGERIDRALLGLPWAGGTLRKFATAQLSRTLATLLGGGIPLVNGLEITVRAMSNRHLAREMEMVRVQVQEGRGFAEALRDRAAFPDVAVKMVEVGESTGALQEMLNSIADFYDEEIETEVGRFMTLIEPVLLIVMGLIIAVVILSLYMPIIQLSSLPPT